jgi:hypothetical protein
MKKIEEQLESIEEVLSLMIRKNASIENLIQTATKSQNKTLAEASQWPLAITWKATDCKKAISNFALPGSSARHLLRELIVYYKDPDRAELETQKREAHEVTVKDAEELLNRGKMRRSK